jgi:hypothetical protein
MTVVHPPRSPEQTIILPAKSDTGEPVFSVLVKRTYDIRAASEVVRAEQAWPIQMSDAYYDDGDPLTTTVQYESDLAPYKLATDVVILGRAVAPDTRPVYEMQVTARVAAVVKTLRVTGDRFCVFREGLSPTFTEPIPFTTMPLRYERAYGGRDLISLPGLEFHYPRNHHGTGVAVRNIPEVVHGLALPNIEDPTDLLNPDGVVLGEPERWNLQPLPQGFGWYHKTWYPRSSFVGAMPQFVDSTTRMREEALGLVPERQIALSRQFKLPSFDARFYRGASLGLSMPYLRGGEGMTLSGMTEDGDIAFTLPREVPSVALDIGFGPRTLDAVLQTVSVRVDDRQVDLVWRGAHPYPGVDWLPEMKVLELEVT